MKTSAFTLLGSALVLLAMAVAPPCRAAVGAPTAPLPPASAPATSCPVTADMAKLNVD